MALDTNATKLADLFNPQVVGDMIEKKLIDAIRFTPLAVVNSTLVGQPGDEVTLPSWNYIGDAATVTETQALPIKKLSQSTTKVKIVECGLAAEITDAAILTGYGNALEQAVEQIVKAVASKVEESLISAASTTATLIGQSQATSAPDLIAEDLELFGEDMDGDKVLICPPAFYTKLRKANDWIPNTEMGAAAIIRGTIGMVHGCQVVVANRLKTPNEAYIIKPGALAIYSKRDTLVEFDRDVLMRSNIVTGSKMYAPYLYDKSKLIKISL